jgi:UDP-glucose 4-epimerase
LNGDGLQTRDYIYVKDTVDAFVKLSKNDSCRKQVVNVARGQEIAIGDLIRLICRLMSYDGPIEPAPARSNDVRRHYADNTRLKSFIDFSPSPFEQVLPQVIDYYREGGQA